MKETKLIAVQGKPLGNGVLPAIITPLVGKTQAAILEEVAAIVPKKPDLLEWRIDFFESIGDIPAVIDTALAIRRAAGGIPVLLTRRNETEGGQPLKIDEAAVVAMYTAACTRELRLSLRRMCCTWIFTVASAMASSRATSLLLAPLAISERISRSRGDRLWMGSGSTAGAGADAAP